MGVCVCVWVCVCVSLSLSMYIYIYICLHIYWLLTEEHIVRDIIRCAMHAGNTEVLPIGSD